MMLSKFEGNIVEIYHNIMASLWCMAGFVSVVNQDSNQDHQGLMPLPGALEVLGSAIYRLILMR
jgi:hypothetical protein